MRPAQSDLQVSLSSTLVKLGEPVEIYIRVEGDVPVRFGKLSEVEGLEFGRIGSSGSRQSVTYDARGRARVAITKLFRVRIAYTAIGKYEIPPLTVEVDGTIRTAPATPMLLEIVNDIQASQLLVFESDPMPARVYEGEPYVVELRFGWDMTRKLDDAELQLPWWQRQDGVVELAATASQRGSLEIPIRPGRRAATIEEIDAIERDGRKFKVYRLRRRFVATRPGKVEFGRSVFKFSELISRTTGVFTSGTRRSFYAALEPFEIEVLAVPEEGRPLEWTGAVGRIEASRDALRRDIDLGDAIAFQVRWTGDANLEFFDPPDLSRIDAFDQFRVLGVTDEKNAGERLVTYELVPRDASVNSIPPVPLRVFDTSLGRYVVVETKPLEIRVKDASAGLDDPFGELAAEPEVVPIVLRDIVARPIEDADRVGPGAGAGAFALLLAIAGWIGLRRGVRRRGDPASAAARRRRNAARHCAAELRTATGPADTARALEAFLAARTGEVPEAWIGRAHLADGCAGPLSTEIAGEYEDLRRTLDRAVFSGEPDARADSERVLRFAQAATREGI